MRKAIPTILREQIVELNKELIMTKRDHSRTQNDLKRMDMAVFECIQSSKLSALSKVTDGCMYRVRKYSDDIGNTAMEVITPLKTVRKRKSPRRKK